MSVLLSGGGLRMGQAIGSTNAPKERPLTPNDLWATIYCHLGIDSTSNQQQTFAAQPLAATKTKER